MARKRKPKVIVIQGRRWFQKSYGNTYHSVVVRVDGEKVGSIDFAYGYGNQYAFNGRQILIENGYLKDIEEFTPLSLYCREKGIVLVDNVTDVQRKKDL